MAIKIFRSAFKSGDYILTCLERLRSGPETHAGKKRIAQSLDHFHIDGPNGYHLCLVFEALEKCVTNDFYLQKSNWNLAKQITEAVAYIHEVGVAHGGK